MKQGLGKYISDIFATLQITVPFELYNCDVDNLPEWTKQIQLTHEFLVCCEEITDRQRLQTFMGKNVFEFENYVYWFEGERIITGKIGHIDHPRSFLRDHAFPAAKDHPKLTSFFASFSS